MYRKVFLSDLRPGERVHVFGSVVRRFEGERYVTLILDDFSGRTGRVVGFGEVAEGMRGIGEGDIVDVLGRVAEDGSVYVDAVLKIGGNMEVLRRAERVWLRRKGWVGRGEGEEREEAEGKGVGERGEEEVSEKEERKGEDEGPEMVVISLE